METTRLIVILPALLTSPAATADMQFVAAERAVSAWAHTDLSVPWPDDADELSGSYPPADFTGWVDAWVGWPSPPELVAGSTASQNSTLTGPSVTGTFHADSEASDFGLGESSHAGGLSELLAEFTLAAAAEFLLAGSFVETGYSPLPSASWVYLIADDPYSGQLMAAIESYGGVTEFSEPCSLDAGTYFLWVYVVAGSDQTSGQHATTLDLDLTLVGVGCPCDCQATPDGVVDVTDFLAMLATWGQVGAPCDFNGDGVDANDFLELLANWGPCP